MIRRFKDFLTNPDRPMYDRCFTVTSMTAVVTLTVIFLWDLLIGESFEKLLMLGICIVLMLLTIGISLKTHKAPIGSTLICLSIIFVVLPWEFFTGGGVYGCTPIWYAYAFLFISLNESGVKRYLFLILLAISAVTCYVVSYYHPSLFQHHTVGVAYLDSIASLIGVGVMLWLTVGFLMRIYNRERIRAEEQAAEINELNRAQNHFFSSMSHEIRTPINTIIGLNEMILREDVSPEVSEDAMSIQSSGRMLLHLVNDILDMSKIESGKMQLTPVNYHTGDMLSEIVNMIWTRARDKGLDFRVNIAPDLPGELKGDDVRIKQILINVLNNSVKYTKEGSVTLSIQCEILDGGIANVVYSVTDTGIGIKQESIPYLFTAFKRVDEEKNRHIEGTGLGLSIVKELVDLMGGRITVNSVYTQGTTFIIEIPQPIVDEKAVEDFQFQKDRSVVSRSRYEASFVAPKAQVLVVDDNQSNLMVAEKLLRDTRVQIDTATSGAEALERTLSTGYHVIFMDHLMPEMDGIECLAEIRRQIGGLCKETPVVALTANSGSENQELYAKAGFDGYLLKPVTGQELERELFRLLPGELVTARGESEIADESMAWMQMRTRKIPIMITTESVADLPADYAKEHRIGIIPHIVVTDRGEFNDGVEIESRGLIDYMRNLKNHAGTKAPDVMSHEMFFAEKLGDANNIIHISISSRVEHSGYHAAVEASRSFENVHVVDSAHLSSGQGLIAMQASIMAEAGYSVPEILESIESIKKRVHTSFIVDNMDYLARAGQIHRRVAGFARAFMVHPELVLKKGKMTVGQIFVGSRENVWKKYIRSCLRGMKNADRRVLFVTFVELTLREQEWIRERIEEREEFDRIIFQKASPGIAVNSGPGTFGLLYLSMEESQAIHL